MSMTTVLLTTPDNDVQSSPNISENLVNFFSVFAKLDHLACNTFSKITALFNTINVEQELFYMSNSLTYKIHNKIAQSFQRCWGNDEKMIREKFC